MSSELPLQAELNGFSSDLTQLGMSLDAAPRKPWKLEALAEEKGPLKGGAKEGELGCCSFGHQDPAQ